MTHKVRTNSNRGLRLRASPHDGATLAVLPSGVELEVLAEERWLQVRQADGQVGFVSADFVEPVKRMNVTADATDGEQIVAFSGAPFLSDGVIRIHRDFLTAMRQIGQCAENQGLQIFVTSALRRPNQPLCNSLLSPTKMSNHHAGHAIDINLIHKGDWLGSNELAEWKSLPVEAKTFFHEISGHDLRWGRNFSPPDPVHIDDGLNVRERQIFALKVMNIWGNVAKP